MHTWQEVKKITENKQMVVFAEDSKHTACFL